MRQLALLIALSFASAAAAAEVTALVGGTLIDGSSLLVMPPLTSTDFLSPLRRLLSEPAFASAAIAIADQHRARMPAPMMVLLSEINTLLEAS